MTTPAIAIPGYAAGTWDIDPVHSHIGFVARHLMVSKVRGRFDKFEAQLVTAEDLLTSYATATIDLNSINTGNQTRDDDLRSDNFFAAATYPVMTYRSTGIRRHGGDFMAEGELTIRRVTRPVSLKVEIDGFTADSAGTTRAGFSATGEINRIDFGVCTNLPIVGLASKEVHLALEISAILRTRQAGIVRHSPAHQPADRAGRVRRRDEVSK